MIKAFVITLSVAIALFSPILIGWGLWLMISPWVQCEEDDFDEREKL